MIAYRLNEDRLTSFTQIREMLKESGPCASIYLRANAPQTPSISFHSRLHTALAKAKQQLERFAADKGYLNEAQVYELAKARHWDQQQGSLAIFCTGDSIHSFVTPTAISDSVHVGEKPYIRPLLPILTRYQQFAVLALSQKHVRLLKCTDDLAVNVDMPVSLPHSVEQAGAFDIPDHVLENRSSAGASSDARRRIRFGTNTAEEKSEAYLSRFFKIIDDTIQHLFASEPLPLILAGVHRETALYRKISNYPRLLTGSVHGSPDDLADSEIHHSARHVLRSEMAENEKRTLRQFYENKASHFILADPDKIVEAARLGQIHHLLVSEDMGDNDEQLNLAVVLTVLHRGKVSLISSGQNAMNLPAMAMLRYSLEAVSYTEILMATIRMRPA